jgi:pimeloyl-ACP methyl ester carboxylesterase
MTRRTSALAILVLAGLLGAVCTAFADDSSASDQFFDSAGVKIHYQVWGDGDPVVLVHGFTASIDVNWVRPGIVAVLAKDFRVIALDARGHGKSDKPHDPGAYGDEMVMDVVRLLDHLHIEKAHVVGYSMGGFITLKLVSMHPERLLSATLGGAGWRAPGEASGVTGLAESLESGNGIAPLMIALTPQGQPTPSPEQINAINQMLMATNDAKALAAVIRGIGELEVPESEIKAIDVPMLAVIGEIDPLRAGVEALDRLEPELEVVVLPGKDHATAIADPALAQSVHAFVVKQCHCA